ncbi:MAG: helix-turn-helix domain-containing protein [Planctomycetota bacterium]|nr:MAG: helix-turn-helix domain-containing protein [Planctomycetota bacterium]
MIEAMGRRGRGGMSFPPRRRRCPPEVPTSAIAREDADAAVPAAGGGARPAAVMGDRCPRALHGAVSRTGRFVTEASLAEFIMATKKYLSLEEAAERLNVSIEELRRMRERGEIRGFADRGTWKFRVDDIEKLARSRTADSDPEVPLGGGSALDDELSDQETTIRKGGDAVLSSAELTGGSDSDVRLVVDESLLPEPAGSDSDVKLTEGAAAPSASLHDSDSDVKLAGKEALARTDSDVRLAPPPELAKSDSDVRLAPPKDLTQSDSDVRLAPPPAEDLSRSDSDVRLAPPPEPESDSDVKLAPPAEEIELSGAGSDSDVRLRSEEGEPAAVSLSESDSEIRLVDDEAPADSDSDVKLFTDSAADDLSRTMPMVQQGSDSDVKVVGEEESSSDVQLLGQTAPMIQPSPESSRIDAELAAPKSSLQPSDKGSDSDVQLIGEEELAASGADSASALDDATDNELALLSDTGSELDLGTPSDVGSSVLVGDESDLLGSDSGVSLGGESGVALASESGIALERAMDSGIALEGQSEDEDISLKKADEAESDIALEGLEDSGFALDAAEDSHAGAQPHGDALSLFDEESGVSLGEDSGIALERADDSGIALDAIDDSGIALEPEGDSGIALDLGEDSGIALADDEGSDIALAEDEGSGIALADAEESGIALAEEEDSGITLADDSGIALGAAEDSGIALGPADDDVTATMPAIQSQGAVDELGETAIEFHADEAGQEVDESDFEIGPLSDSEDATQSVLLFDDEEDEEEDAATVVKKKEVDEAADEFAEFDLDEAGEEALDELEELDIDEEGGEFFEADEDVFEETGGVAGAAREVVRVVAVEPEWDAVTFVGVSLGSILMALCALLMVDLVRTMWGWQDYTSVTGPILDMIANLFQS